jgi:outer membrane receptor for ferrienterochelin and colicins
MTTPHFTATRPRTALLALLITAAFTPQVQAQDVTAPDLSLEALMQVTVEPVFGASLRLQPMTEAPASVTIITADDIARHGYETVGDILADVRGFHVTNDRNYSYIGARGFALPGDYNTRVLLLVDGHRINDAIFEQATLGRDMALDVSSFARVEIIRGPASALYGTSAFFAVVNIVTKTGRGIDGVEATVRAGTQGAQIARLAAGRAFRNGIEAAVSGTVGRRGGPERLYFEEFDTPDTNNGIAAKLDDEDFRQLSGRVTFGAFTVSGATSSRDKQVPTASYDTVFGDPRLTTTDARTYVNARYERDFDGTRVTVQSAFDRYRYEGIYPEWSEEPFASDITLLGDYAEGRWWTLDGRASRRLATKHTVTVGMDSRHTFHEVQSGGYDGDRESEFLIANTSRVLGLYGQNEFAVNRRLLLTAGLRYDRYAGFDRVTPRLAAVFKTSDDQAFKYLFGNAFRAPNAFELDYYSDVRRLDLKPETITSHELVWERYTGRWLRTSASGYLNTIADLIGFHAVADDYRFDNIGRVRSRGLELEAEARHRSGWRGQVSYVLQEAIDRDADASLMNSPRHALKVQASASGPWRSTAALSVQHLSSRLALDGSEVGRVALAHLSIRVPITREFQVTALVRNMFDEDYADPGSAEHRQRAIPQDGRSLLVGIEWTAHRGR